MFICLQNIEQADEDWYTCELENSAAKVSQSAFVNVQGKTSTSRAVTTSCNNCKYQLSQKPEQVNNMRV